MPSDGRGSHDLWSGKLKMKTKYYKTIRIVPKCNVNSKPTIFSVIQA
jgi:hypothetical protein